MVSRATPSALVGLALLAVAALCGCKVALTDIAARFLIADVSWFAEEETMFVFYEVTAEQGLGAETVFEIRYTTDDGVVDWTDLEEFDPVHTHLDVDCGPDTRCGSTSIHLPIEPRAVEVRMRYHREGELTLDPETRLNIVGPGPPHTHRSLLVYGVFTEDDIAVQWRARHRFPTLRNMEAERLGLRRRFTVQEMTHTAVEPEVEGNAYRYGRICANPTPMDWVQVDTEDRAIFSPEDVPDDALSAAAICATSTVWDATGTFETTAVARKNPEVRPAFPLLRSPIREAVPIKYLVSICDRTISTTHLEMQQQRLLMTGIEPLCIDDFTDAQVVTALVNRFRADLEVVRAGGQDMVLALALHHDDRALSAVIEGAIGEVLATERGRNTPRLAGAFLLDSYTYAIEDPAVGALTLWCPSALDLDEEVTIPTTGLASLICALPDQATSLSLGPFDVGALPILPDRSKYLSFIDTYSEDQAGTMTALTFLAPELPPDADHLSVDPFGTATFFNDEVITAEPDDSFSFCQNDEYLGAVFRSASSPELLPLAILPDWHAVLAEDTYGLGIAWDFPFLLQIEYVAVGALAVSAFGASLPLGLGTDVQQDYGSTLWTTGEFPLEKTLKHCTRYCGHPTFDSAGVYQVEAPFDETYRTSCYAPVFPQRGDSGFPNDP